jgi:hypothetical protein
MHVIIQKSYNSKLCLNLPLKEIYLWVLSSRDPYKNHLRGSLGSSLLLEIWKCFSDIVFNREVTTRNTTIMITASMTPPRNIFSLGGNNRTTLYRVLVSISQSNTSMTTVEHISTRRHETRFTVYKENMYVLLNRK